MTEITDTLASDIDDLWSDEGCRWEVHYYGPAAAPYPWTVSLEWSTEGFNPHGADWATYAWNFYDAALDDALAEAVTWLRQLAPWKRCGACGGEGDHHQAVCPDCHGSGLASDEAS